MLTLEDLEARVPRGTLHKAGKGRSMRFAYFAPGEYTYEEVLSMGSWLGRFLEVGKQVAPLQVFYGPETAEGWEPVEV